MLEHRSVWLQTIVSAKNRILLEKKSRKGKIKFGKIGEGPKVLGSRVLGFQGLIVKRVWSIG